MTISKFFSAFVVFTSPTHSHSWSKVCKVISGSHSNTQKTSSFSILMLNRIYFSYISLCFFVQPCLNFEWQLKLSMAITGVIFSKSIKIERLFQFPLMTCYLPYTYQNHYQNERHACLTKTRRKNCFLPSIFIILSAPFQDAMQ